MKWGRARSFGGKTDMHEPNHLHLAYKVRSRDITHIYVRLSGHGLIYICMRPSCHGLTYMYESLLLRRDI